jgi:hypothetical protein
LGIKPEEIPMHLPDLTLAQVFDALSFYLDNQQEINEYIERNRVPEELVHPKAHLLDRRAFLKLPVAQRNALLSQQAYCGRLPTRRRGGCDRAFRQPLPDNLPSRQAFALS